MDAVRRSIQWKKPPQTIAYGGGGGEGTRRTLCYRVSEDKKITLNPKQIGFSVTLAAEEGFEPSQTESESAVLPLHNSASHFSDSMDNYRHPASVCQEICCIFSVYSENTSGEDCGRQESLL